MKSLLCILSFIAELLFASACHPGPSAAYLRQMEIDFQSLQEKYPQANLMLGREVYLRHCSVCHQADGSGAGAAIPPLVGHAPRVLQAEGGRSYAAYLMVFGVNGRLKVKGRTYLNMMPALGGVLDDEKASAALNFAALSWGNHQLIAPESLLLPSDVAQARKKPILGPKVLLLRPAELEAEGVPPQR